MVLLARNSLARTQPTKVQAGGFSQGEVASPERTARFVRGRENVGWSQEELGNGQRRRPESKAPWKYLQLQSFCHSSKRRFQNQSLSERKTGPAEMKQTCSQSKMSKVLLTFVVLYIFLLAVQWISRSVGQWVSESVDPVEHCQPTYFLLPSLHQVKRVNIYVCIFLSIFLKFIWILEAGSEQYNTVESIIR